MNENIELAWQLLPLQLWNTLYMVTLSTFFGVLLGLPIGIILALTDKGQIKENAYVYKTLEALVNIGRSFPFAILMVALIPFTRFLIGTSLGTTASIIPLTIAAAPFFARLVETALKDVDSHIVEAALMMGSNTKQMIAKVYIPEALPSLVSAITLTAITLIGYSAMAGLVGGGGLGQVAIQYGYNRFNTFIMTVTVILIIILVQATQWLGSFIVKSIQKKRGKYARH